MCRVNGCNNNQNYIHNFCKECWEKYNYKLTEKEANNYKKIYLKNCNDHGRYICCSTFSKCPKCIEENEKFEKEFNKIDENTLLKFKIINRFIGKFSEFVEIETKYGIKYFKKCTECNKYIMIHDHVNRVEKGIKEGSKVFCPGQTCFNKWMHKNNAFHYRCQKCGEILQNPSQICPKCNFNPDKYKEYKCEKCGSKLSNALEICSNCGYRRKTKFICPNCGKELENPNITCKNCGYSLAEEMLKFNFKIECNKQCKDYNKCKMKK